MLASYSSSASNEPAAIGPSNRNTPPLYASYPYEEIARSSVPSPLRSPNPLTAIPKYAYIERPAMVTSAVLTGMFGIGPQSSTAPLQSLSIRSRQFSGALGLMTAELSSQSVPSVLYPGGTPSQKY